MLRADNLSFAYDAAGVLHDVSIAVGAGDLVGILGPNGSGKSTLLRLLSGSLRPDRGRVSLDGVELRSLPRVQIARRMAVVPQETHLAFDYPVIELALMGRYPHLGPFEVEGPRDLEIAAAALAATGTSSLANRSFATLSGGEKQRVVIAGALAQFNPDHNRSKGGREEHREDSADAPSPILLLDEPTASLDPAYQLEIASILRRLNSERGLTIIVSTHDLNFAASVCTSLVLLREGRVLAAGATRDVLTPAYIAALYGVEAEVRDNPIAGHLTVVPLARVRR